MQAVFTVLIIVCCTFSSVRNAGLSFTCESDDYHTSSSLLCAHNDASKGRVFYDLPERITLPSVDFFYNIFNPEYPIDIPQYATVDVVPVPLLRVLPMPPSRIP